MKISYHLYELLRFTLFERKRDDFPEFLLHHLMTWALIQFSYSCNYIPIGACIMFVHDYSDLLVSVFKICADTTHKYIEMASFLIMFSHWLYFRLYIFPFFLVHRLYEECFQSNMQNMNYGVMNMMMAFLVGLVGLHAFWSSMMIKGLYRKIFNPRKMDIVFKDSATRIQDWCDVDRKIAWILIICLSNLNFE